MNIRCCSVYQLCKFQVNSDPSYNQMIQIHPNSWGFGVLGFWGFVIQGNHPDELPEQMLVGMRLHSLDPMIAPDLPDDMDSTWY